MDRLLEDLRLGLRQLVARPGFAVPFVVDGVAKEIRPGTVADTDDEGSPEACDDPSGSVSVTAIAVTHATTVARARAPASQSLRVPGAREVSGAQPFSQGWRAGGSGVLSGMCGSSSGARGGGRGRGCSRIAVGNGGGILGGVHGFGR